MSLTPERLENLRRAVTGVTRVRGLPWKLSRTQLAWFVRHGWLIASPHAGPSSKRRTAGEVARTVAPTEKAIAALDAVRALECKI